jgi:hypothetical protein
VSAAPPVRTPDAKALLEWIEDRQRGLSEDSTYDRARIEVYQKVWRQLVDVLPYVEAGALVMVTPGVSYSSALSILGLHGEAPSDVAA